MEFRNYRRTRIDGFAHSTRPYITKAERRRADDRHERGAMLGCVLFGFMLLYLFLNY